MYFIGTDVGTTGTKTVVSDEHGRVIGKGYYEYELHAYQGGRVEQDAGDWWRAVVYSVREALAGISDKENVLAMSLSAQGGSTLAVDKDFTPISPAYTWMDARAAHECGEIAKEHAEYVYNTSGWRSDPCFDPPKMRWLAKNEPDVFNKAYQFVSTVEYVNYKLTGRSVTDPSCAAMRQLISVHTSDWDDKLLDLAGITRERLPECLPAGAKVGSLTKEAAAELGLSESVAVYNGAHDQYCASIGSGAARPGDLLLSTGTTWVVLGVTDTPLFTESLLSPGVHPVSGLYGNIASLNSAGSALKWFGKLTGETDFACIDKGAEERMHSAENILFYPYYAGAGFPHHAPDVKASCIGMELMHDKYDLARALMEGAAFETRCVLEEFEKHGAKTSSLKMVGGAAKSPLWTQITCDVTKCEIMIPEEKDTCCIGAAIIAAVGCGFYPDFLTAADKMVHYSKTMYPIRENAEFYERKYARYKAGFESLKVI